MRNHTLIAAVYYTFCRRSGLVSLRHEDLAPIEKDAMFILIRRAKNDTLGDGRYSYLVPPTVEAIKSWLDAVSIKKDWPFCNVIADLSDQI